jgi:hypothetical protein
MELQIIDDYRDNVPLVLSDHRRRDETSKGILTPSAALFYQIVYFRGPRHY